MMKWLMIVLGLFCFPVLASEPSLSAALAKQVKPAYQFYQQEQYGEALRVIKAVQPKAGFELAYIKRFQGNLHWLLNQPAAAITSLSQAVAENALPKDQQSQTQRMLGDLYLSDAKAKSALKHYQQVTGAQRDAALYLNMAQAHYQLEQWQGVVKAAERGIKLSKGFNKSATTLLLTGYYQQKNYAKAATILTQLSQHEPSNKQWWLQLSSVYLQMNDKKRALSTLEIAYQAGMLSSAAELKNLARLRANAGLPYQAADLFASQLKNQTLPYNTSTLKELAGYWQLAREYQRAATVWGQVAKLTGSPEHYLQQVALYSLLQQPKQALSVLETMPTNGVAGKVALAKTQAWYDLNQYQKALQFAQKAQQQQATAKQGASWVAMLETKLAAKLETNIESGQGRVL
ncbi:tetratricopeptide repeat protein [Motilimonas cestriensis]|uniref:tetratricopeptide repeat protein n=1 Tax=Motilimonas cestriensis TaxID=2742685 RepID=UPI003DA5EC83